MLNAYFYKRNRENYLKLIELAINGKIYISESSEKQKPLFHLTKRQSNRHQNDPY